MGIEILTTYKDLNYKGEELWTEFISTFRPHSIKQWGLVLTQQWTKYLVDNDVYVERRRHVDKTQKLIDIL